MVALCPLKAPQAPSSQGKAAYFQEEEEEDSQSPALFPRPSTELQWVGASVL